MKRLKRNWKAIIGWTLFFSVVALVAAWRYQWSLKLQDLTETAMGGGSPSQNNPPGEPDDTASTLDVDELENLMEGAMQEWARESSADRERSLASRLEELEELDPDVLDGVVTHLMKLTKTQIPEPQKVEILELDVNSSVPVNMEAASGPNGEPGIRIEMMDQEGRSSFIWVDQSEVSAEEEQALRAFTMINRVPGLEQLRPLLAPLLRSAHNADTEP